MRRSKALKNYLLLSRLGGVHLSEWQSSSSNSPLACARHYAPIPADGGPWSAAVLFGLRAATAVEHGTLEQKAIAAACTTLMRQRREEEPEGSRNADGQWHPQGKDAAVFVPVHLGFDFFVGGLPVPAERVCRNVRHCAALYGADLALTRRFIRALRSKAVGDRVRVLRWMPDELAAETMIDAISAAHR